MFNYKEALQNISIEEYIKNPLTCDCSHSPFQYNPSGHVITGDLNENFTANAVSVAIRVRLINIDNYFAFSIFKPSSNLFVLKK
jgi:hypothetical protein